MKLTERISPPLVIHYLIFVSALLKQVSDRQLPFINFKKSFPPGAGGWEELLDEI
jgi:hypothetical protein